MPWLKVKLHVAEAHAQPLADALEEWGAISVTLEDAADQPLFETHWDKNPIWSQVRVTGLFPEHTNTDDILARTRELMGIAEAPPHEIDLLGDEDWAHSWMAHYKPLQVGRGLWVVPSWCAPPEPNAVNIILDPGLAFGTGDHPTTSLCLEWLSEQTLTGKTLLDYGNQFSSTHLPEKRKPFHISVSVDLLVFCRRPGYDECQARDRQI